ncbi:hypothetical protein Clacol_004896 [Clathrus columnatus]|uniref:Exocyst complex subunit Exo70 C-terminal domain-containing protein n=1 Tax=Clathrus columnatus TaxID=1419009 RepID=A0AAV5ABS7_9AGAM|nr:hypothetical protein Clacol_004896 [Clathrus columnatus]
MEDEAADIELLEQHLNKTKLISQRMTGILTKFDARLVKLEKTILPLHKSTLSLTKVDLRDIDRTLKSIEHVVTSQGNATSEEALIMRGPQPAKLSLYTDALNRLNANFAFAPNRMPPDAARLVETGAKKLTQLYTKLVAEGSSGSPDSSPVISPRPFGNSLSGNLTPLVSALRSLPVPSTHPSHPAAPAILTTLKEGQKGYAEMRGQWCRRCIDMQSHRVMDRIETMENIEGGKEFGRWVEGFLSYVESEYSLLQSMAPIPSITNQTFDDLLQPLIILFQSIMSTFISLIKRAVPKYTFLALSAYSSLMALQGRWADLINKPSGRRENELGDGLYSLRAICLRSFPEFLADIKLAAVKPAEGQLLGTGVTELVTKAISFLEQIPLVEEAVVASLATLGDGNWRMGEGVGKGGKVGSTAAENDRVLLEHYIHDVVTTLINTLNTLSKGRRPQMGSIYLLNNISSLRSRLLDSTESTIDTLISKETLNIINSNFRIARAAYFDSNFSPLIQSLGDDKERSGGLVGSGRSAQMKEKWSRFFDAFEELAERHRVARVMPDDPDGRVMLQDEAVRLVLPLLLRFTEKHKDKEFMATFSWGDTARAAFATCFPCFPQSRQTADGGGGDDDDNNGQRNNISSSRREELESLLRNAEFSDGEMDTDALSLHSGIGDDARRQQIYKRQRRRRRKNKGSIRLFGYDLFGKAFTHPDENDNDDEQRRISRLSSSTLDSDPAPVEDDLIARLSTNASQSQIQQIDEDVTTVAPSTITVKKDKLARKEKRRQRKLSSALLNVERTVDFEGFQGSGGDSGMNGGPSSPSSVREEEEFGAFQGAELDTNSHRVADDFVRVPCDVEDDADLHADFDAVAYVRRNSTASRSDSGSGSRSHTSTSITKSEGPQGNNNASSKSRNHLRPPSLRELRQDLLSPLEVPTTKPSKRSRRSTTSGSGTSANSSLSPTSAQPRRSRRSTTAGSSTSTTTSTQPRSPISLHIPNVHIVQPSEEGGGHLRISQHNPAFEGVPEDDGEFTGSSPLPSPLSKPSGGLPTPTQALSTSASAGGGFPSTGLGGRRNSTISSGVFLARTGDNS